MINAIYLAIIALLFIILYITLREEKRSRPRMHYRVEEYWKGPERRGFRRISKTLEIDYTYVSSEGKALAKKEGRTRARSSNISWGGMQLLLPEKIKEGTRLSLEIQLENSQPPIRAIGEVVWMEEAADEVQPDGSRFFRTGMKFVGFSTEAQDRLAKFLYEDTSS